LKVPLFTLVHLRDGREYIIHAGSPAFIAEVVKEDGYIDIKVRHIFGPKSTENPQQLAGLMSRMGDWYTYRQNGQDQKKG
jgi:hypothetical protein